MRDDELSNLINSFGGTIINDNVHDINDNSAVQAEPVSEPQPQSTDDISSLVSQFGGTISEPEKPKATLLEDAGRVAKGFASDTAGFLDLILSGPQPKEDAFDISPSQNSIPNREWVEAEYNKVNPELRKIIENKYHEITGFPKREKGESIAGDVAETTGGILSLGIPGTGIFRGAQKVIGGTKEIAKAVGKNLAKDIPMAVGASTALNATPNITDEESSLRPVEDFAKMITGSIVGSKSDKIAKSIKNSPLYIASLGSDVNEAVIKMAKEKGIKLPFNVGMDSKTQNFLANNYLKSMFVSDAYKKALKESDESMVNAVKKSIDSLGDSTLTPKPASDEYAVYAKKREEYFKNRASKIYDYSYSLADEADSVKPKHAAEAIRKMKKILDTDLEAGEMEKLSKYITRLAEKWGIDLSSEVLKKLSIKGDPIQSNPKLISAILDKMGEKIGDVPVERLIGVKKAIGDITKYDKELVGYENLLNGLSDAITKDLESSTNRKFVSELKNANKYFKEEVADSFRTDLARSLLSGEIPIESFNKMNSVENIRHLREITGEAKRGKEVFNALAKAKVREIFSNSINDGSLSTGNFSKIMSKKEKTLDLLQELMGPEEFKNLKELGEIAAEYSKAGKDLLNTSGTAPAHADIQRIDNAIKSIIATVKDGAFSAGGVAAGYAAGGLPGAAIGIATPNIASRLLSNEKFVETMRDYAIARKNAQNTKAANILKRAVKLMHETESGGRVEKAFVLNEKKRQDQKEEKKRQFGDKIKK